MGSEKAKLKDIFCFDLIKFSVKHFRSIGTRPFGSLHQGGQR